LIVVSIFSILRQRRAERRPHLSSFLGALIFDWACAHNKEPLYLKEKETTIIELLCLVPTRRVGTIIFPWHPAIARVLRERRPHFCSLLRCHDGSGRGDVLALCAEGNIIIFSLHAHEKAFSPPGPFLFTGTRHQCVRNQAALRAGGRADETIDL
jgi:hypothetical protein